MDIRVHDETWGSDHYPILININVAKNLYTKKTFRIKCVRTVWEKFAAKLDSSYCSFLSADYESLSPNEKYNYFIKHVTNAINFSSPSKAKPKRKFVKTTPRPMVGLRM